MLNQSNPISKAIELLMQDSTYEQDSLLSSHSIGLDEKLKMDEEKLFRSKKHILNEARRRDKNMDEENLSPNNRSFFWD